MVSENKIPKGKVSLESARPLTNGVCLKACCDVFQFIFIFFFFFLQNTLYFREICIENFLFHSFPKDFTHSCSLIPQEEEEGNEGGEDEYVSNLLTIPRHSRRLSSITVSSSDTSYLERRGSALEMGLPVLPSNSRIPPRISRAPPDVKKSSEWDFYYPIDIRVSFSGKTSR